MKNTADVIVVGAGIIGNAIAYYTAKKGHSVIVLEKSEIVGNGGSSRNGGGVRQSGRDARELPLAMYGIENLWPGLSDTLGYDVEYVKKGNLRLGKTPEHLKILEGLAATGQRCGLDMRMIDGKEVREINPYMSNEVIGASWCPTDGHANPLKATLAFYMKARELGVQFLTSATVTNLKKKAGKLKIVETDKGTFEGDTVILACGMGARPIAEKVGIDIPMKSVLIEALITEQEPEMFPQMLGTAEADFYGHQTAHGSFLFGGSSGMEDVNADNGTPVTHSITAPCICRGIIKYLPRLAQAKIVRTWAGWMDHMVDGVPVIDRIDEVPGLILACGFSGHGFGIAPAVGMTVSELVEGTKTTVDISGLTYDRFKAKA